jgi:nucleoside-diphosphate-sugar epimerase
MRILVTGGGGFLGGYIVRALLLRGRNVRIFQRSPHPGLAAEGAEVVTGSLAEKEALRRAVDGCGAVIHTAAKAGVWGSRNDFFSTNVDGTRNLLEAMGEKGCDRLVHCSSPSVVFDGSSFAGEDESLPYGRNWTCDYPESKAVAEEMVLDWGRSGKGRAIALRPHLIVGDGDPHLLPRLLERGRSGRLRIVGDGTNKVDLTRVENVAAAHLLALDSLDNPGAVNRPYFISQGEPVVLWEWINRQFQRRGVAPVTRRVSLRAAYRLGWLSELVWRLTRRRDMPPMTRFLAVELAKSHWFSIGAARATLGYAPEDFPLGDLS